MRRLFIAIVFSTILCFVAGCTTTRFMSQAAKGQWRMQHSGMSLEEAMSDADVSAEHKKLLGYIPAMKAYAEAHGLKATENYEQFVQIEEAAVSWVVTACPPLSLEPKTWSFPVAGSFTYLGWFHEKAARKHADRLRGKGYDVHIGGASAYSTLGHFKDPVVSTMLESGPDRVGQLADTLFHESAHATIYLPDQSYFNESVAQFIGTTMAIEYQQQAFGENADGFRAFQQREEYVDHYRSVCHEAYKQLRELYNSELENSEKLTQKNEIMKSLQAALRLKELPNNAFLVGFKTYHSEHGTFQRLYDSHGRDWSRFISSLSTLNSGDFPNAHTNEFSEVLDALVQNDN